MARGTDHEEVADLEAFRTAYCSLPEFNDFMVVDANGTPEDTLAQLNMVIDRKEPVRV